MFKKVSDDKINILTKQKTIFSLSNNCKDHLQPLKSFNAYFHPKI